MMGFCSRIRLEKREDLKVLEHQEDIRQEYVCMYINVGFTSCRVVISAFGHVIILRYYKFMPHWRT